LKDFERFLSSNARYLLRCEGESDGMVEAVGFIPQIISQRMLAMDDPERGIEYLPPPAEVVNRFAYQVCYELGEDYTDHEVMSGFAEFMNLVVTVQVKHANAQQQAGIDDG
jgi:hypothetical protein